MPAEKHNAECHIYRDMTVANIRDEPDSDHVKVVFLESARFYRLNRNHPGFDETIRRLREALAQQRAVRVGLESLDTEVICEIRKR